MDIAIGQNAAYLIAFILLGLPVLIMGWAAYFITQFDKNHKNKSLSLNPREKISYIIIVILWLLVTWGVYQIFTLVHTLRDFRDFSGVLILFLVLTFVTFYVPIKIKQNK